MMDPQQGLPAAILDASTVTAYRTAAVSAAATEELSLPHSRILGLIGAGRQCWEHLQAIAKIRPIEEVLLWGRSAPAVLAFAEKIGQHFPFRVQLLDSAEQVARGAQILVTATASHHSFFSSLDLPLGAHVNAIGACRPGMQEIVFADRPELKLFMDSSLACGAESSEIGLGLSSRRLSHSCLKGELGHILNVPSFLARQPSDITVFKSVGLGIEDLYAGAYFYGKACQYGLGTKVEFP
jgi:ornithine cyclodeaminase